MTTGRFLTKLSPIENGDTHVHFLRFYGGKQGEMWRKTGETSPDISFFLGVPPFHDGHKVLCLDICIGNITQNVP